MNSIGATRVSSSQGDGVGRPHGHRYPWDKWFEVGRVILRRGKHYHCLTHGMIQTIRQAAARYGIRVRLSVAQDTITLEVKDYHEA